MKSYSKLLRVCFLIGAITDGLAVVPMLSPNIGTMLFGGEFARLGVEYRYAMGIGAALMAGWTVLLLWGSIKPVERRDLLVITIFPVVTGIVASTIYGISRHVIEMRRTIPLLVHLGLVSVLYLYSYGKSRGKDKGECI
jgi:hypothetical protein